MDITSDNTQFNGLKATMKELGLTKDNIRTTAKLPTGEVLATYSTSPYVDFGSDSAGEKLGSSESQLGLENLEEVILDALRDTSKGSNLIDTEAPETKIKDQKLLVKLITSEEGNLLSQCTPRDAYTILKALFDSKEFKLGMSKCIDPDIIETVYTHKYGKDSPKVAKEASKVEKSNTKEIKGIIKDYFNYDHRWNTEESTSFMLDKSDIYELYPSCLEIATEGCNKLAMMAIKAYCGHRSKELTEEAEKVMGIVENVRNQLEAASYKYEDKEETLEVYDTELFFARLDFAFIKKPIGIISLPLYVYILQNIEMGEDIP